MATPRISAKRALVPIAIRPVFGTARRGDVVGLYLAPPERAIVLSADEKTQIQALDRTAPMLPLRPGQVERPTHDYIRLAAGKHPSMMYKQTGPLEVRPNTLRDQTVKGQRDFLLGAEHAPQPGRNRDLPVSRI